jgi:hypothetical protein
MRVMFRRRRTARKLRRVVRMLAALGPAPLRI